MGAWRPVGTRGMSICPVYCAAAAGWQCMCGLSVDIQPRQLGNHLCPYPFGGQPVAKGGPPQMKPPAVLPSPLHFAVPPFLLMNRATQRSF